MTHVLEDFVNREAALQAMWKVVRGETAHRILLVCGRDGIGKTYLLEEFGAECDLKGVHCVSTDFAELQISEQSYLSIVLNIQRQLGPQGFELLLETIAQTRKLAAWDTVDAPAAMPPAGVARAPAEGRSGGVDFYQQATVYGDVAGRDLYNVTQIIQRDDPVVQQVVEARISAALLECLVRFTKVHPVILLLNSWEQATAEVCNWVCHNLLSWIATNKLTGAAAVLAGEKVPDLPRLARCIKELTLEGLPEDAVSTYWQDKRCLPPEDLPHILKYSMGFPVLLAMMADQRELDVELSG
jgi:hypothetical protein